MPTLRNIINKIQLKRSLLKDWRFWVVQASVICISGLHIVFEQPYFVNIFGNIYFIPISLFWVPVIYGVLTFGFVGAFATVSLAVITSIPHFFFLEHDKNSLWEIPQLFIMLLVAIILANLINRNREARQRARQYAAHSARAREEERREIGRELHDETTQSFINICQELDALRYLGEPLPKDANDRIIKIRERAEQAALIVRNLTKNIRPSILDNLGVLVSIRRFAASFSEGSGIETEVKVIGKERRFVPETETIIFRIFQEAMRNVQRHSKATEVSIAIAFYRKKVVLLISDNGLGFNVSSANDFIAAGKFGILGMHEYAEMGGGRLTIESNRNTGTRITASLPILDEVLASTDAETGTTD